MCLHVVDNHHIADSGVGYKVFRVLPTGEYPIASEYTIRRYKYNYWYTARSLKGDERYIGEIRTCSDYSKGFHIFENKIDAWRWADCSQVVKKVMYKEVICSGYSSSSIIVANKIRILDAE